MDQSPPSLNPNALNQVVTTCTCFKLRKAARTVTQLFDETLKPCGLLVTQFTILVAVAAAGSGTMNELAQILVMDRTTLTRNLKPLERQGFITIEPGADQRTRVIQLTVQGRLVLATALPLWEQAQTEVVQGLGQERWNTLLSHLSDTTTLMRRM